MDERRDFQGFVRIIKALRAENGCPWDREQTHGSLKPCMTEEAAELLAAIRIYDRTGDAQNMREELGDILLQVVMHSVIAEEEGLFTIEDVVDEVSEKMIRRHPHVFGTVEAETSDQVLANWEEIKKKEKEGKSWIKSPLREIPQELPALARACKVIKKADKLYENKEHVPEPEALLQEMEDVISRMRKAMDDDSEEQVKEIFSHMMWKMTQFAYKKKLSPEQLLTDVIADKIEFFEPDHE